MRSAVLAALDPGNTGPAVLSGPPSADQVIGISSIRPRYWNGPPIAKEARVNPRGFCVSRVVSDLNVHARHPGLGPRSRPAGAEARPSLPFGQLLDRGSEAGLAPPKNPSERTQASSAAATSPVSGSRPENSAADQAAAPAPETPATDGGLEDIVPTVLSQEEIEAAQTTTAPADGACEEAKAAVVDIDTTTALDGAPAAVPEQPTATSSATVVPVSPPSASATATTPEESAVSRQLAGSVSSSKPVDAPVPQTKPNQTEANGTPSASDITAPGIAIGSQTVNASQSAATPDTSKAAPAPNAAHSANASPNPMAVSDPAGGGTGRDARTPPESVPQDPRHGHLAAGPAKVSEDAALTLREVSALHIAAHPGATASAAASVADAQILGLQRPTEPLGNPTAPAATPAPDATPVPVGGLAVEIAARAQAGRNRFEIRLDPPEFGRIDVRLDVDSNGQVTSRLVVERAETLDVLRRDAGELERALQQAGLKTADNGLQFALRDQGFAGRNDNGMPANTARLIVPDLDFAPAEIAQEYGRALRLGGGIDIRV
jgi:flagellar hook-length control protein FliK